MRVVMENFRLLEHYPVHQNMHLEVVEVLEV
jgi:hypothetical protein